MPPCPGELIRQAYTDALKDTPSIGESFRADIAATVDRDPATRRLIEPVLYYKGFHAIQAHRLMHWLWQKGRKRFRSLPAEPFFGGVSMRHPSGREDRPRDFS